MDKEKAIEWIALHSTGISSRTMWCAFMGIDPGKGKYIDFDVPRDCCDFSRCYDLVEFTGADASDLQKVCAAFPFWKPIIDHWDMIACMYKNGDNKGVSKFFDEKREEIMKLKGFVEIQPGIWKRRIDN